MSKLLIFGIGFATGGLGVVLWAAYWIFREWNVVR